MGGASSEIGWAVPDAGARGGWWKCSSSKSCAWRILRSRRRSRAWKHQTESAEYAMPGKRGACTIATRAGGIGCTVAVQQATRQRTKRTERANVPVNVNQTTTTADNQCIEPIPLNLEEPLPTSLTAHLGGKTLTSTTYPGVQPTLLGNHGILGQASAARVRPNNVNCTTAHLMISPASCIYITELCSNEITHRNVTDGVNISIKHVILAPSCERDRTCLAEVRSRMARYTTNAMTKVVKSAPMPTKLLVMVSVPLWQNTSGRGGQRRGHTEPFRQKWPPVQVWGVRVVVLQKRPPGQ